MVREGRTNIYLSKDAERTRIHLPTLGRRTIVIAGLPFSGQKLAAQTFFKHFEGIYAKDYNDVSTMFYGDMSRIFQHPEWLQPIEKTDIIMKDCILIEQTFGFPARVVAPYFQGWYEKMSKKHNPELVKRQITEDLMRISKSMRLGIITYNMADMAKQLVLYHPYVQEEFKANKDAFKIWIDCDLDYCVYHAALRKKKFDREVFTQTYLDKVMVLRQFADVVVPNYGSKLTFTKSIIKLGKEYYLEEKY